MILQYADQFAYIVLLPSQKTLRITVRRPRAVFGAVPLLYTSVDVVEALCTKWFSVRVTKLVSCAHCLAIVPPVQHTHDFKLNDLELDVVKGATTVKCPTKNGDVEISSMLPGFVREVSKLRLQASEVTVGKEIGRVRSLYLLVETFTHIPGRVWKRA